MSHFAGVHSCFALYAAAVHINVLASVDSRLHIEQLLFFCRTMSFAIVEFTDDESVEVVPCNWLMDDICFWPAFRAKRLTNAIMRREEPDETWSKNKARAIRSYG